MSGRLPNFVRTRGALGVGIVTLALCANDGKLLLHHP